MNVVFFWDCRKKKNSELARYGNLLGSDSAHNTVAEGGPGKIVEVDDLILWQGNIKKHGQLFTTAAPHWFHSARLPVVVGQLMTYIEWN